MTTVLHDRPELTPRKEPLQAKIPQIRSGSVAAVYYGQRCSGDFYDFLRVSPERVLFGLFDVAGDLQHTREIVVAIQEKFRSLGATLLEPDDANESESLMELWIEMNRAVMKAADGVHSCPAFLGSYNDEPGTVHYVNAGHTPAFVRHAQKIHQLNATALPLGLFTHSVPDASVVAVHPGDRFLLVSKGVVEATYRGEEYGIERLQQHLDRTQCDSAHETCVSVLDQVRQFMHTAPTHNDVTALALVRST